MKKLVIILVLGLLTTMLTSCQSENVDMNKEDTIYFSSVEDVYGESVPILNTFVMLNIYNGNNLIEIEEETYKIMKKYHQLLDNYRYYHDDTKVITNIKTINDSYGMGMSIVVDEIIIEALKEAILIMELTEGYFNPFLGILTDLWNPKFSPYPIENVDPSAENIYEALACVPSYDQINDMLIIDEDNSTIKFNKLEGCNLNVSINLGGFTKGYILNKLTEYLNERNESYLFNLGYSSLYLKENTGERIWKIGTTSPYESSYAYVLSLHTDIALSTSGDSNKFFLKRNEDDSLIIRSHLLNPFSGYSESSYRTVTVISDDNQVSEVLSTTLFVVQDIETQRRIIKNFENYYNITIEVIWYYEDSYDDNEAKLIVTSGAMKYLELDSLEEQLVGVEEWEKMK